MNKCIMEIYIFFIIIYYSNDIIEIYMYWLKKKRLAKIALCIHISESIIASILKNNKSCSIT